MTNKLLITLPCRIEELKERLDECDKHDIVICQYDGDGDSLDVSSSMEPLEKPKPESKDISECKYFLGCHCNNDKVREFGSRQIMSGLSPFICPFHDGNDCKEYEPKTEPNGKKEPRINGLTIPEYVRTMERAHEATKNSKLVFK